MENSEDTFNAEEQLLHQHRKEKKDLQSKIQALKKSATKGDKKKKKEVQEEITKLENDLQAKHVAELASLQSTPAPTTTEVVEVIEELDDLSLNKDQPQKVSKAQKRRKRKEQANKEREQRIAEQEIENVTGRRNVESEKIKEKLLKIGLMLYEIPSDGDCLYTAVSHGLANKLNVYALRKLVSKHIQDNPDDFLPFLTDPNTGEQFNNEQFIAYCAKVASSKQWGGHVELVALSHVLKKCLVVIQEEGPDLIMGENYKDNGKLLLTYHRHMYGLGEHYNSVQPFVAEPESI